MTRCIKNTLLAATAASVLLLTAACGGSGSSDGKIEGSNDGNNHEERHEEAKPTPNGAERPEIVFPEGFENVYEDWESDDPTEQAVLNDARGAQNAVDLAILERNPEAGYVKFYQTAEALHATVDWVEGFIRNSRTIAGTVRYSNPVVTLQGERQAEMSYCGDESNATAVDVETGEAIPDEDSEPQVFYSTILQKNEHGVWVTTAAVSERKSCTS